MYVCPYPQELDLFRKEIAEDVTKDITAIERKLVNDLTSLEKGLLGK